MTETWREIPGWEGFYAVSDEGRVKSLARVVPGRPGVDIRKRERILTPWRNRDGYVVAALSRDNKRHMAKVHRLVLLAFVGPAPEGTEACHADGSRNNNRLANLRWDTRSANTYDRVQHGTHASARKTHCLNGHPFDVANTYIPPGRPMRMCRTCMAIRKAAHNQRKKAAA